MKETLISFETAKLAKEKGFNMECPKYWSNTGHAPEVIENKYNSDLSIYEFQAPTQSLLQKWIREEHRIFLNSITGYELDTRFQVYYEKDGITYDDLFTDMFDKYEDSLEEGLYQALKLIKL